MRVCLYTRVSTARQAEQGLSLPDQLKQLHKWCETAQLTTIRGLNDLNGYMDIGEDD
jgi:DNA invertase Pin-like site-specific DNA recombinase